MLLAEIFPAAEKFFNDGGASITADQCPVAIADARGLHGLQELEPIDTLLPLLVVDGLAHHNHA